MTFHVNQKVICVDDGPGDYDWGGATDRLAKGRVYTISQIGPRFCDGATLLSLEGVNEHFAPYNGWRANRFRPVVDSKTTISFTVGAPKDSQQWDNRVRAPARKKESMR